MRLPSASRGDGSPSFRLSGNSIGPRDLPARALRVRPERVRYHPGTYSPRLFPMDCTEVLPVVTGIVVRRKGCGAGPLSRTSTTRLRSHSASGVRRICNLFGPFEAARSLFHFPIGFRTDAIRQDFPSVWADPFQGFSLSASSRGLVDFSDTHRDIEKEMSCVTKSLTGATKCL